ncbi:MAG: Hsp70 family protein, partial [Dehalococcoidales bacterium]|nr:Hsp70 family protein [Dehalococcoidales bacterium]
DAKRRDEVEAKNMGDTMAYQAEKTLRDNKDKVPAPLNQEAEAKIAALRSALQGSDASAIKQATQALNEVMQKIGAAVYQAQQPPPGGPQPPPGGQQPPPPPPGGKKPGDEGTVEGEFREV